MFNRTWTRFSVCGLSPQCVTITRSFTCSGFKTQHTWSFCPEEQFCPSFSSTIFSSGTEQKKIFHQLTMADMLQTLLAHSLMKKGFKLCHNIVRHSNTQTVRQTDPWPSADWNSWCCCLSTSFFLRSAAGFKLCLGWCLTVSFIIWKPNLFGLKIHDRCGRSVFSINPFTIPGEHIYFKGHSGLPT